MTRQAAAKKRIVSARLNLPTCNGCERELLPGNTSLADGCPCNSPRGVNHGLVSKATCTCTECDPAQTGATRTH